MASLSIVIPILNEIENLPDLIQHLNRVAGFAPFIFVDGGSDDGSVGCARSLLQTVLESQAGRSLQMNKGASVADTDYILFLHADTRLPENFSQLFQAWAGNSPIWGFFPLRLDGGRWLLRIVERAISARSRLSGIATGDQAICVDRSGFEAVGKYRQIALMEDIVLSSELLKKSSPVIFDQYVTTSSRRWEQRGVLRTIALMWWIRLRFYLGADPDKLARMYC